MIHLQDNLLFDTQIVATKELPPGSHIWLKALTRKIDAQEAGQLIHDSAEFPAESKERELADSVLQVSMSANYEFFENLKKEDPIMCNALRELMRPEMEEALKLNTEDVTKRVTENVTKNVTKSVTEQTDLARIKSLMAKMNLTVNQAMDILDINPDKWETYTKKICPKKE